LASLLHVTDRFAEAELLLRRALDIDEAHFGSDHPRVATHLSNLAMLLLESIRHAEAETLLRRALTVQEKCFGSDHPNVATSLNNLALLLRDTKRLAEAMPLLHRALAICEQSFGPYDPSVAVILSNLAGLFQDTKRPTKAASLGRRCLVILHRFELQTGHRHPEVLVALANYERTLRAQGLKPAKVKALLGTARDEAAQKFSNSLQTAKRVKVKVIGDREGPEGDREGPGR
jgi:tetratricopeptide (TPR) repeat protein